jgi:hypothetical protein
VARDVQLEEPSVALLDAARQVVPGWLRRVTIDAAVRGGVDPDLLADDLDDVVLVASTELLERLGELLATDVDLQRTTPLSLLRSAIAAPTALLRAHGAASTGSPSPGGSWFPGDPYGLGPATWSDVDAALHEPGLMWGAWKAMTVLARRRDEGLR